MSDPVTVINAGGQNYAVTTDVDTARQLAETANFLKLQGEGETMYVRAATVARISVWDSLPTHHGRLWTVSDANQREQPQRAEAKSEQLAQRKPRQQRSAK